MGINTSREVQAIDAYHLEIERLSRKVAERLKVDRLPHDRRVPVPEALLIIEGVLDRLSFSDSDFPDK